MDEKVIMNEIEVKETERKSVVSAAKNVWDKYGKTAMKAVGAVVVLGGVYALGKMVGQERSVIEDLIDIDTVNQVIETE